MGGMSQGAKVIESEDVEEESDEEDQEAHDQCQNEEARQRETQKAKETEEAEERRRQAKKELERQRAEEARREEEERRKRQEGRKSRRKLKIELKNEFSTITVLMEVQGQEMMRIRKHVNLTVQRGREIPRQDAVNESKIERTTQQYDCECERVLTWLRGRVKFN